MKLVTWNVNSIKVRLPRVLEFLAEFGPNVVCMQETKCEDEAFPVAALAAAGYHAVHHSAGRWAGVAIAARDGLTLEDPVTGLPGELREDGRAGSRRPSAACASRARTSPTGAPSARRPSRRSSRSSTSTTRRRSPARRTSRPRSAGRSNRSLRPEGSSTRFARCIPTRSATRGGTTARATSTARWACASTSCSCPRPSSPARARHRAQLPQGDEAVGPRAARGAAGLTAPRPSASR